VPAPAASIAICSKDRRAELRRALASALEQDAEVEVLVLDDGSSDGTSQMVRDEFPSVTLLRNEVAQGPASGRNQLVARAQAPVVVCIDDDAVFTTPQVVSQTLRDFDGECIGAVAIPMIDRPRDRVVHRAPDDRDVYALVDYFAAACAYRRDAYAAVGGMTGELRRAGEEPDLALRMLKAGWITRCGTADLVDHQESPNRDAWELIRWHGQRNDVLLEWRSVPMPYFAGRLVKLLVQAVQLGRGAHQLGLFLRAWLAGVRGIIGGFPRDPMSRVLYRAAARMRRNPPMALSELAPYLPEVGSSQPQRLARSVRS
jgi:glycosyltransferase involved in cell wall biosynthesis